VSFRDGGWIHICLKLQGRDARKGGIDVHRTSRIYRVVCCYEVDPSLYRGHGHDPCLGRDLDDGERKTCVGDRGNHHHLSKTFWFGFVVVGSCRVPSSDWKCFRVS